MRAIQHQAHAVQAEVVGHGALAELDVARLGIVDAVRLAQAFRRHGGELGIDLALDRRLDRIVELLAVGREELDAVVLVRIVRGADDDAGVGAQAARQERHRRRRHRAEQAHVGTGGDQARLQRRLEHVAGHARVLADQHRRPFAAAAQGHARRATQAQHELGGDRPLADLSADAVGAEVFALAHDAFLVPC